MPQIYSHNYTDTEIAALLPTDIIEVTRVTASGQVIGLRISWGDFQTYLAAEIALGAGGAASLADTLAVGNTTGGNSIITSDGDSLQAANGGGYLNLRAYDTDNNVLLTTDDENYLESGIEMYPENIGIWANGYKASLGMGSISAAIDPNDSYTYLLSNKAMIQIRDDFSGGAPITNGIYIVDPNPTTGFTAPNADSLPATICSRNSTLNDTVRNSVALGGTGLTVAANNTAYMQNVDIVGTTIIADQQQIRSTTDNTFAITFDDTYISITNDGDAENDTMLYVDNNQSTIQSGQGTFKCSNLGTESIQAYAGIRKFSIKGNLANEISHFSRGVDNINHINMSLPTFADNTAAGSGGLVNGDLYKTATGEVRIKY